ncbi:hypothetical protein [Roseixanthobacter glucoisosaccharinicivorans]
MNFAKRPKLDEYFAVLSASNSVGATILLVVAVAALCAVFSTFFWWIR